MVKGHCDHQPRPHTVIFGLYFQVHPAFMVPMLLIVWWIFF